MSYVYQMKALGELFLLSKKNNKKQKSELNIIIIDKILFQ